MPEPVTIWLVIFGISAVIFFGVAAWVAVTGVQDVRDLLRHHEESDANR